MDNGRWLLAAAFLLYLCSSSTMALPVSDQTTNKGSDLPPPSRKIADSEKQKLLVILLDGFRWNYPTRTISPDTSAFKRMAEKGVKATYLQPVFPTMSYPNYHSLVTGMYPENHGMVMNHMYDEKRDVFFDMLPANNSRLSFWWNETEPIWMRAAKSNLRTYLYDWPGCEVVFNETLKPKYCKPYEFHNKLESFHEHIDDVISKFADDQADFAQIYVEYADYIGHKEGPESTRMTMAIRSIDEELNDFITLLEDYTLEKKVTKTTTFSKSKLRKKTHKKITTATKVKVNVIVVSDHGMTATDEQHIKRISLSYVLNMADIRFVLGQGASVGVYPHANRIDAVYNALMSMGGIDVWKKADIPEKYHMKNSNHTPPIFVLAKKGYFIEGIKNNDKQIPRIKDEEIPKGYHGYDPDEVTDMRGIFYAFGYGFKRGKTIPSINTVDVYNMMTHLLNLEPRPNNGTWKKYVEYFKPSAASSSFWCNPVVSIVAMFVYGFVQTRWLS